MKMYKVTASYVSYCHAYVQAENEDEAYQIAKEMDGGDFEPDHYGGDWTIEGVHEFKEQKI